MIGFNFAQRHFMHSHCYQRQMQKRNGRWILTKLNNYSRFGFGCFKNLNPFGSKKK